MPPTYASPQDYVNRFGREEVIQTTNLDNPEAVEVNTTALIPELENASREIDSALGVRYDVPLESPVPGSVRQIALTIARYNLEPSRKRDDVKEDYKRAQEYLAQLADRKRVLVRDDGMAIPFKSDRIVYSHDAPDYSDYEGEGCVFTPAVMARYPHGPISPLGEYHSDRR